MAGEEKTHTQGEVDLLVAVARVETLQCVMNDDFKDHKKEDGDHFDNLYEADKEILAEIALIPTKMFECSEGLKTEVLTVARKEFATIIDFKVFRTWLIAGMVAGTTTGSIISSIIVFFLTLNKAIGGS